MKYVKINLDFAESIRQLGDTEAGRLLKAIVVYAEAGEEPTLSGNERILWGMLKKSIDGQRKVYDTKSASMAAARELCPNYQKTDSKQTENCLTTDRELTEDRQMTVQERKEEEGGKERKERSKEKRESPQEGEKRGSPRPPSPPPEREPLVAELLAENGEPLRKAVDEWLRYKREKRETYKPIGLKQLLNKIKRYAESCGEHAVTSAIYDAMSSNYQGIVWDRLAPKQAPSPRADDMQGKYNMMQRWANG